ncbi:MAG: hypothetical protein R2863_08980 [Candidatus Kapaibacterium sp.]|nr:hypothetical protein [Ignavibacteriota bacterium]
MEMFEREGLLAGELRNITKKLEELKSDIISEKYNPHPEFFEAIKFNVNQICQLNLNDIDLPPWKP